MRRLGDAIIANTCLSKPVPTSSNPLCDRASMSEVTVGYGDTCNNP